jgi:hypothetical protein
MTLEKHLGLLSLSALALILGACSSGGSSSSTNAIASAVQDLGLDDEGTTTVLTFASDRGLADATTASFEADGGQTPLTVTVDVNEVTIVWDERVTPSHDVRAIGLAGVSEGFHAVTTSDPSAPTFTITAGTQNTGPGTDEIELAFDGPRVVEATAEDAGNWTLTIDGTDLDLTGSTFDFDAGTQTMTITLGPAASLHATFDLTADGVLSVADVDVDGTAVAGTATGDAVAPGLLAAEQNLTEDEFGRIVDFTFDEAMSAAFSTQLSDFGVELPAVATAVEQPAPDVLRVTFNLPIVPGVDDVTLDGLVDLHGNAFPTTVQPISQPSPVVNGYDGLPLAVTVPDAGNDFLTILTTQAFDPESAEDPARWSIAIDTVPVDLSTQTLAYDLTAKTLTIQFDFDMPNGATVDVTGVGVLEVDGQAFNDAISATSAGDATAPSAAIVTQNRNFDPSGRTLDVEFDEDLDEASAETLVNWAVSGTQVLQTADLLAGGNVVRLVFDAAVIPGDHTLSVDAIADLAGNTMPGPQLALAVGTSDSVPPDLVRASARAVEGIDDDVVLVTFDDDMLEAEVEDVGHWSFESPVGTPISLATSTADYNPATRVARLVLHGWSLRRFDDFSIGFTNVRDLGGNVIQSSQLTGDVRSETNPPELVSVALYAGVPDALNIGFSEPCAQLDDLYDATLNPDGTRYVLRAAGGAFLANAISATPINDFQDVLVQFGVVVGPTDTVDVFGVEDLAGNPLFPVLATPSVAADGTVPDLAAGLSTLTAFSGESNDVITIVFDRPMSPYGLLQTANYTISSGGNDVDLTGAELEFDGTSTVTIRLGSGPYADLQTGAAYDITVEGAWSAQGVQIAPGSTDAGLVCGGDAVAPGVLAGDARVDPAVADALIVAFTEAVDESDAEDPSHYDLNAGNLATAAELIGPRHVRVTFGVTPLAGDTLQFTATDLAGNTSTASLAVTAADTTPPLIVSVAGTLSAGWGGDTVSVIFNEPVDYATALSPGSYQIQTGATVLSLVGATFRYASATDTVTIELAGGQELVTGAALLVTVAGVADVAGNAMPASIQVGGPTSGDATDPDFDGAFVNLRADPSGTVVDVRFSEDVDETFLTTTGNWTATGTSVSAVEVLERDHCRVTLTAALGAAGTLGLTGLPDVAGNVAGALTVDPLE